ncbi:CYFA0S11e02938g1_1 [Cyberlindnera fabianii]|uniref:CYFA0S11e02938g1_1 n=1 Tax=Cyberlindnera fabianii TaxID=36022 RepID=A0A061B6D3_CYBFA|nr:CYFA0S11e02938g1_1 [Cyberlindnera fabianii]
MSSNKERVHVPRNPVLPAQTTPEQRFWRGYTNTRIVEQSNFSVSHIHFNPQSPHDFAVTSSTRINVFSSKTREVVQTYSRFKDTVYSGVFNQEGRLLMAGDFSGLVQIFQTNDKSLIRTIKPTSYPTMVTRFHPTLRTQLLTASDDRVARLYDLSDTTTPVITFDDHEDYVRTADFIPGSNLVATGCYDGVVRIFDARTGSTPVAKFNQGSSVLSMLPLTPTSMAAGGSTVKIWDMAAGKQIHEMGNFQKDVVCLASAGADRGILAGSLDGHVKVFDPVDYEVKFGWKFAKSVMSCGVSPNSKHFVAGLHSGTLVIKTKKTEPKVKQGVKQQKSNAFKKMMRGAEYHGEEEHRVLNDKPKTTKKLRLYEKHLNAFRWSAALDAAFVPGTARELTVAVLEELKKRGKVRASLYGRDEATLEPLLTWSIKAIEDVRAVNIVSDWVSVVTEMYGSTIEKSTVLEEIMISLRKKLQQEVEKAREAQKIEGMLQLLTAH